MTMKELRDIFANVKEQGDLDKRLLEVFEMGVRAGAEEMWGFEEHYDSVDGETNLETVTRLAMEKIRP
jgi:hypothetical protein